MGSPNVAAEAWADGLRPAPPVTVAEWSNESLVLDDTTSAEPGRYRWERTPYVREPMQCLSVTSPIQKVVLMWGAQLAKSTTGNAWVGYVIDNSPGPMLVVQPRVQDALDYSRLRIEPMIAASPRLRDRVAPKWTRDGGNTLATKKFPGGVLLVTGANSAAGLKSRPIRYLFLDEVDEYPWDVEGQGDPIALAIRRTNTFGHRRKVLITSTPTIKGKSRIEAEFEQSDQRRFQVPCPRCGEYQVLEWDQFKWPKGKPEAVGYECRACERRFAEPTKREFLPHGRWVATADSDGVAGFHLPSWYSPLGWLSWPEIAREFVARHGDRQALKVVINQVFAETYEDRGEAPDWQRLYERREDYPLGTCPAGVRFVTVGADVQRDRVELFAWGWGLDKESWLVDHVVAEGDPYRLETWVPVTEWLHQSWPGADGQTYPVARFAIDTGDSQEPVIDWARRVADRRVMLVKGDPWKNWTFMVGAPSKSEVTLRGKRTGLLLWPVGGALIKQETYGFLQLEQPVDGERYPPGYIHLPMVSDEFVKQLVAEKLVTRTDKRGFMAQAWEKQRHRNEALDGRVYARAAAEVMGLGRYVSTPEPPPALKEPPKDPDAQPAGPRKGWLDRGRRDPKAPRRRWLDR